MSRIPKYTRAIRILLCGHPNPMGCPNHGDVVREVWQSMQDEAADAFNRVIVFAEDDNTPIPYSLTAKGKEAVRALRKPDSTTT